MEGTPKQAIQPLIKVKATSLAVIKERGKASGHRVNQSIPSGGWEGTNEVNVDSVEYCVGRRERRKWGDSVSLHFRSLTLNAAICVRLSSLQATHIRR